MYKNLDFGKDFTWGVATSSYQIEGGHNEGGRRPSIWDTFSHTYGKVKNFENGDVACDHYHRMDEDIALLKELGVKAYRFSISWSRLLPDGFNPSQEGINFYNNLINKLLENGIQPFLTMYHWDLPQSLQSNGGWENRDIINWFDNYSSKIVEYFGDRVKHMITLNEPSIFVNHGYKEGVYAPGLRLDNSKIVNIVHNVLCAHGKAVKNTRRYNDIEVGITLANNPMIPDTLEDFNIRQARESQDYTGDDGPFFLFSMRLWGDPIFYGKYADGYFNRFGKDIKIEDGDMELISQKLDFVGINTYTGNRVGIKNGKLNFYGYTTGMPMNSVGWRVEPDSLYYVTKYFHNAYHVPIYITENGYTIQDSVCLDGKVHDAQRIDYIERYLNGLKKAQNEGIDIRGYFYWSFMDNFEWADGYTPRFGLVFVDFLNGNKRIPKDSYYWYKSLIS